MDRIDAMMNRVNGNVSVLLCHLGISKDYPDAGLDRIEKALCTKEDGTSKLDKLGSIESK